MRDMNLDDKFLSIHIIPPAAKKFTEEDKRLIISKVKTPAELDYYFVKEAAKQFEKDYHEIVEEAGDFLGIGLEIPLALCDKYGNIVENKYMITAMVQTEIYLPG